MNSRELYNKMTPSKTEKVIAQLLADGLSCNLSTFYSKLIKDAARCNRFNSDIVYDINGIQDALKNYRANKEFEPIWIGFRRHGVDGTNYVLCRVDSSSVSMSLGQEYFALYSVDVEYNKYDWYNIVLNEYWM